MTTNHPIDPEESSDVCVVHDVHTNAVSHAVQAIPPEDELKRNADMFKLLTTPARQRILLALEVGELCVCDIAEVIGLTVSAASHQLQLLRRAGAVTFRSDGKQAYYRVRDPHFVQLIHQMIEHNQERRS